MYLFDTFTFFMNTSFIYFFRKEKIEKRRQKVTFMNKSKLKDEEFCWKTMKKKEFNEMETGLNNYKKTEEKN